MADQYRSTSRSTGAPQPQRMDERASAEGMPKPGSALGVGNPFQNARPQYRRNKPSMGGGMPDGMGQSGIGKPDWQAPPSQGGMRRSPMGPMGQPGYAEGGFAGQGSMVGSPPPVGQFSNPNWQGQGQGFDWSQIMRGGGGGLQQMGPRFPGDPNGPGMGGLVGDMERPMQMDRSFMDRQMPQPPERWGGGGLEKPMMMEDIMRGGGLGGMPGAGPGGSLDGQMGQGFQGLRDRLGGMAGDGIPGAGK